MTVEEMKNQLKSYKLQLIDDEMSKSTITSYLQQITEFLDSLGQNTIVTKECLLTFKSNLIDKGYKSTTVNSYIVAINKFFKFCNVGGPLFLHKTLLPDTLNNPDLRVKTIKLQKKTSLDEVLEVNEYKRLLRKAKEIDIEMYWVMKILGSTGIRIEELKYFTFEEMNKGREVLNQDIVKVYNKGKERDVPVPKGLRAALVKYARSKQINSGTLFPGHSRDNNGVIKQLDNSTIWRRLQKVASKVTGLKKAKVHPHAFRHLFAREYLAAGGNIADLADILGHEDLNTTRIYNTSTVASKRKQMEKMYK